MSQLGSYSLPDPLPFIHSLNKYLLCAPDVPVLFIPLGHVVTKIPLSRSRATYILGGETDNEQAEC